MFVYHLQDLATEYWNRSMNGYTSGSTTYESRHLSGETYIPYVVGSAIGGFRPAGGYFNTAVDYPNYPGLFVGYAYAYGEYNHSKGSKTLGYARYTYLGIDGYSDSYGSHFGDVNTFHTNRMKAIGSLH